MTETMVPDQETKQQLHEIVRKDVPFEQKARDALELGKQYLDTEQGYILRIDQETDHWRTEITTDGTTEHSSSAAEGDLQETYCRETIKDDAPHTLHDAPNQGWADDPAFETGGNHTYLGIPLILEEEPYGTICFVAEDPRSEPFSESETWFAEYLTRLLERELERKHVEADLTSQTNLAAVLNRVLRHNFRNDISVIRGHVQMLAEELSDDHSIDTALDNIDSLITLTERARELEQVVTSETERQPTAVGALVEDVIETVAEEQPQASLAVEYDEDVSAALRPSFERAIRELLENAINHVDDTTTVSVTIDTVPNAVEIQITDNGPGLPEMEAEVLSTGEETPLSHGQGLGLWLVHWIVTSHEGSIDTTVTDDGTMITLSIPRIPGVSPTQKLPDATRGLDRFQAAFEEAHDTILILNDDAQIVNSNTAAETLFGLEWKELIGRPLTDFTPDAFDFDAEWRELQQAGAIRGSVVLDGADGVERTVEYSGKADLVPGEHVVVGRDITERVEQEQALQETKQRLDLALEGSETGVWDWDIETDEVLGDETLQRLFGIESSTFEETLDAFIERVHPDDRGRLNSDIQTAIKENEQFESEYRIQRDDGRQRWVRAKGEVFLDGESERMVGVISDITEQKEREQELHTKTRAIDKAPVGITLSDPNQDDNPLVYANERFCEQTGYEESEVVRRNCRFLQGENTDPERVARIREAIDNQEPITVDLRNYRKDGTEFWNRLQIAPVKNDEGEVLNWIGFQDDITEQKERERELESLKERYETLLEAGPDPVFVADTETGELIEVNEAAATVIGEPREEIIGRDQRSLHPREDAELYEERFKQATGSRTTVRTLPDGSRPKLVTADDELIPIEISVNTVPLPGGPVIYGVFRELPDRSEREQQLERERNRLDRFASVVSHDLRSPLNVAAGRLDLAAEECDSPHLDAAGDAIDRMEVLTEDLLELAKQGRTVGEIERIDLATAGESCWQNVPAAEATLRLETDQTVRADRSRLQQLLENLMRNAVDYGGTDVTVTIGTVDDGFYVADDGPGIPDVDRDEIFAPGYSTDVDGSGFGLSIVKEIVDAHSWEMSVTESDSGGARFEVTGVEFDE